MMKYEFEQLASTVVSAEDYKKIEKAYMHYDNLFPNKESIAQFYKLNGMSAINALCSDYDLTLRNNQLNNSLNTHKEICLTIDSLNELIAKAQCSTRGITSDVLAYVSGYLESEYSEISRLLFTIIEATRDRQADYESELVDRAISIALKANNK